MPDFSVLGPLMKTLHQDLVGVYYLLLPVCFALSLIAAWFQSPQGGVEFMDAFKRFVISTILLVAFPDISRTIIFVADGIAEKIDAINSLDQVMKLAQEKANTFSFTPTSILLQFNDLILATLSFASYLFLYVARYVTVALYYFFWIFFTASAPLLILLYQFRSTSHITANLFKGMIEVASWKIVWSLLGVMLTALSFSDIYRVEGNYLVLMVMNFVIAIAMLMTPMMVKSITGSGLQAMAAPLGTAATAAIFAAPAKAIASYGSMKSGAFKAHSFVSNRVSSLRPNSNRSQNAPIHHGDQKRKI